MNWDVNQYSDAGFVMEPMKAIVGPRPIGWISSVSATGKANLAPYSFFNLFSTEPFYLAFGSSGRKDSLRNIEATGEFVVNLSDQALANAMNISSLPVQEDEFALAGLEKADCVRVKVPRVAAAPASLECKHFKTLELPNPDGSAHNFLIVGEVVHVHLQDRFFKEGRVNTAAMQLIARHGYTDYSTVESLWQLRRPG